MQSYKKMGEKPILFENINNLDGAMTEDLAMRKKSHAGNSLGALTTESRCRDACGNGSQRLAALPRHLFH